MRYAVLGTLALISLAGCSTTLVDAPANAPSPVVLPDVATSVINIPITVDLDVLSQEVVKLVPSPIASGSTTQVLRINLNPGGDAKKAVPSCSVTSLNCLASKASAIGGSVSIDYTAPVETKLTYQAFLRDMNMRMTGNQFKVVTQIDFSVGSKINSSLTQFGIASCGINEPMPKIEFTLPGSVSWGASGDLEVVPGKWTMKWLRPCNITAFQINVESLLNLPLIRDKMEAAVSEAIGTNFKQLGLRSVVAKAWGPLNEPRELHPGIWLLMNPESVGFADLSGNGRTLTTGVMVKARPQLIGGEKPVLKVPPVPAPKRIPMSEGFHIAARGEISLEKANALLNEQLAGKPITASGRTVLIDKLRLYGNGDKAVIGMTLSQPIKGEIYALAKPVFDVAKNEVRFEDVDFSLATSSLLAKSANWMLHGTFKDAIEKRAKFSFDEDLSDMVKDFRDYRHDVGNGIAIRSSLDRVKPQGLFFTEKDIKAFVVVDGKVWLDMSRAARK